jgi:hypothetical protein
MLLRALRLAFLHALESLSALNSTEVTERGVPLSVFSALSGISGSFIRAFACPEAGVLVVTQRGAVISGKY